MSTYAYLDGAWVNSADAHLPISIQGLQYGTAAFEGIRAYSCHTGGLPRPFMAEEHYQRLQTSCEALRITLDNSCEELATLTSELIERNAIRDDCYIRPVVFKTMFLPGTPFGVRLAGVGHSIALTLVPMKSRLGETTRLGIATTRRVPNASMPTRAKISGAYVASALAVDECTASGYDDALLLTSDGRVAEASTSNIILRHGGELVTPSLDQGILPGITRSLVLTYGRETSLNVCERPVELIELFNADEVILVGTGVEISPVTSVSGNSIGNGATGEFAAALIEYFRKLTRLAA